jgi:hypothetical protein
VVLFEVLAGADGRACVETLRACGYSRFFNFKRTLAGNRGGITGYVESLLKGAPITISEIDVSALGHNALVCAVHD